MPVTELITYTYGRTLQPKTFNSIKAELTEQIRLLPDESPDEQRALLRVRVIKQVESDLATMAAQVQK